MPGRIEVVSGREGEVLRQIAGSVEAFGESRKFDSCLNYVYILLRLVLGFRLYSVCMIVPLHRKKERS